MQNFIKTIINSVQSWTKKQIKDSTADWNQNDSNADSYVKNRTHWEEKTKKSLIDEITLDFSNCEAVDWGQTKVGYLYESIKLSVIAGQKYDVIFDGMVYECTAFVDKEYDNIVIGNGAFVADVNTDTGEVFAIGIYQDGETYAYVIAADKNYHTISISAIQPVVHKLDPKYLNLPTNIATTDDVQEAVDVADNAQTTADNAQTTADNAQSAADNAQSAADNAQSTADENATKLLTMANFKTTLPASQSWTTPVYADGKFVTVGTSSTGTSKTNIAAYSKDGLAWIETTLPASQSWTTPVYADGKFVTVGINNSNIAAYSEDGITWTKTILPASQEWCAPIYANGKFVAIGGPYISSNIAAYSEDGITWTKTTFPVTHGWTTPVYADGKFVVISRNSNIAVYSDDGITWTKTTLPVATYWITPVYGSGKFVTIDSSSNSNIAAYSEDGITWTKTTLPEAHGWRTPVYANGKFMTVGTSGNSNIAAYSEDGITWNKTTLPESLYWGTPVYGGGKFVIIGGGAVVAYSEDGIAWTKTTLPVSQSWNAPVYADGKFVTSGDGRAALYSEDGIAWTKTTLPSVSSRWRTPVYGGGKFVMMSGFASTNIAVYSEDGITWTDNYDSLIQNNEDITDDIRNLIIGHDKELATTDDVQSAIDTAERKIDATNPVGTGSFSMNRKSNTFIGDESSTIGSENEAQGSYAFAQGCGTVANRRSLSVSGEYNIVQDSFKDFGFVIHDVAGMLIDATVYASESYTFDPTSGTYTLNEPIQVFTWDTITPGCYFMENTTSDIRIFRDYESKRLDRTGKKYIIFCAEGKANGNSASKGDYAHIVGNGTSDTDRSNAHTLDWEGNAWYAGDVYVGSTSGTNMDEGSKKLATEDWVDEKLLDVGGGGELPDFEGELLCEVTMPSGTEINTDIPLGLTMADLDEWKQLKIVYYGASNTVCNNVYLKVGKNQLFGAILRIHSASLTAFVSKEYSNPNIITAYCGTGNPSTIVGDVVSNFPYFGNETQASLSDRVAHLLDWSTLSRTDDLYLCPTYQKPTIDYTLRIYGITKM